MRKVRLITDGACKGNPGPGGWGLILNCGPHRKEVWGSEPHTTNNRMELTAAVRGLEALTETCDVEIVTDSEYVKNGITKWIKKWKLNGWQTTAQKLVVNQDLWQALDRENARHKTKWTWTKGHAANEENNRADELASTAASSQSSGSKAHVVE